MTQPVTTTVAPAKTPTLEVAKLPLCGDVKDTGTGLPADCRLVSADRAGHTFVVRHTTLERTSAGGDTRVVAIDVVGKDAVDNTDYAQQRTMVETGNQFMFGEPTLRDIDADGRDELLVPIGGGTGGITYAVYRDRAVESTTQSPDFARIGVINGIEIAHTDSGYIAAVGKGGAAEKEALFMKIVNSQLHDEVRVEIDLSQDSSGHVHGTCKIIASPGLAGSGLSDSEATQRFCAEPIVKEYE
ncbi:hypothetical protein D7D52_02005 [Nocardia yunnanensis]|uniref:Uncharacterized protein n=2 Tax=Nocardia yunnanensis TaxID=2382165 RepID=A0A386Z6G6_9NOCA|nr:hypothetical protein D7D52_02005 [Nocardia yunnanensis]